MDCVYLRFWFAAPQAVSPGTSSTAFLAVARSDDLCLSTRVAYSDHGLGTSLPIVVHSARVCPFAFRVHFTALYHSSPKVQSSNNTRFLTLRLGVSFLGTGLLDEPPVSNRVNWLRNICACSSVINRTDQPSWSCCWVEHCQPLLTRNRVKPVSIVTPTFCVCLAIFLVRTSYLRRSVSNGSLCPLASLVSIVLCGSF